MKVYHYIGESICRSGVYKRIKVGNVTISMHETEKFSIDEFYIPENGIISYFKNGLQLLADGTKIYTQFNDHPKAIERARRVLNERKFIQEYEIGDFTIEELVKRGEGHAELRTFHYREWIPKAIEFDRVTRPIIETLLEIERIQLKIF